jgi:hypothetical protein
MWEAEDSPDEGVGCLAIYLADDGVTAGERRINHVEFRTDDIRNRLSFRDGRRLEEVFQPQLAQPLAAALDRMEPGGRSKYLPEFSVTLTHLILRGLKVIRADGEGGSGGVALVIHRHFGSLRGVLSDDISGGWQPASAVDAVALDVLTDIAMPLLDLAERVGDAGGVSGLRPCDDIARRLSALDLRRSELMLNLDLLKRFALGVRPAGPPVTRPPVVAAMRQDPADARLKA